MNRFFVLLFSFPILFMASCNNADPVDSQDLDPDDIYFDYTIRGEEEYENITVKLQFHFGGENGEALVMKEPSSVELDGEVIPADSARMTGVFYEVQKPLVSFSGNHTITFTGADGRKYKETFNFQPVTLANPVPATIERGDMVFDFDGLSSEDMVRVLMTDTSFLSEEINRVDSIKNGRLVITREELEGLNNGPIYLEIIKEYQRPLKNATKEGGRLSISYKLHREFILEGGNKQ